MHRCLSLCLFLACVAPSHAAETARKPNIVFILADDLGYGHLGCFGQKLIQTPRPRQDGLGRDAAFTQCYAGCTVCAPSRSVLQTGYHMGHASIRINPGGVPLRAEDVTIAQVLKPAGYRCGAFGKWGLGDADTTGVPAKHGFDEFFGYLHQVHAHSHYPPYLWHNDKKYPLPGNNGNDKGLTGDKRGQHAHIEVTNKALGFHPHEQGQTVLLLRPVHHPARGIAGARGGDEAVQGQVRGEAIRRSEQTLCRSADAARRLCGDGHR